jgi:hypothetical protein
MKAGIHWKILIPFVLTPILALGLFIPVYVKFKASNEVPEDNILFPLGIFGLLGTWLLLTAILRAKTIRLTSTKLTISRIFTFKRLEYKPDDVVSHSISEHMNPMDDYAIIQFKTKDGKTHSVVSYELRHFDKIADWIAKTNARYENIDIMSFVVKEYGIPFLIGLAIIGGLLIELIL